MGNSKTTPIILCTVSAREIYSTQVVPTYTSSTTLSISWTPKFSESVGIQHLTFFPPKQLDRYDVTWKTLVSVIEVDQISSSFGFRPYIGTPSQYMQQERIDEFKLEYYTNPSNLDSTKVFLDPNGGEIWNLPLIENRVFPYAYTIHCCVRPTSRCCVNDLPVEILEHIFSSFENLDYYDSLNNHLFKVIPLVCKLWNKVIVAFEGDPTMASLKFARLKKIPGKRFKWITCAYSRDEVINFHEYVHVVAQFQPFLQDISIQRPSQHSPLDDLLILASLPTIRNVTLYHWNVQEVCCVLGALQHLKLNRLHINGMAEGPQDSIAVSSSNIESQSQLTKVKDFRIFAFDDSIHLILNRLRKDHLRYLYISYNPYTFQPLKTPIQLFGYENLAELGIYGGNDESNLVSVDFISKTCTPSNLPKLHTLELEYCLIDPTELQYLLHMTELIIVKIVLFMGQETAQNEDITEQVILGFDDKHVSMCDIHYSDGNDEGSLNAVC